MTDKKLDDVKEFWESNPLFSGESTFPLGSRAFFEEHAKTYVEDCFAGEIDPDIFPDNPHNKQVLDLGCGPGFWTIELSRSGAKHITASDLTEQGLMLAKKRAAIYEVEVETCQQNAERMTFPDGMFTHVNCQGVIHHAPNTEACVKEIARVLGPQGSALITNVALVKTCSENYTQTRRRTEGQRKK